MTALAVLALWVGVSMLGGLLAIAGWNLVFGPDWPLDYAWREPFWWKLLAVSVSATAAGGLLAVAA